MNLSVEWIPALRSAGIEAVHWSEVGSPEAGDGEIMTWARKQRAVILTRDLDFGTALARGSLAAPSLVQLRVDQARPERQFARVRDALTNHGADLERGAILTLDEERTRVRILGPDATP